MLTRLACFLTACVAGCAASNDGAADVAGTNGEAVSSTTTIAVSGRRLVDQDGKPVRLLGVNFDGGEYMCIQNRGIFDGPSDDALASAIAAWKVNVVRMGINEQCWLGAAGVDARWQGQPYRDAVGAFVGRLRARGIYVILEAHVSSSIAGHATAQQPMIDRTFGLPFWESVASTFARDRGVLFDVYNEPALDAANTHGAFGGDVWQCWLDGCIVTAADGEQYTAAGMQPLVTMIRAMGAENVILLGGLAYANDLSGLVSHLPYDPKHELAASFHVYASNACTNESCWNTTVAGVAAAMPLVTGEVGQQDCNGDFVARYMGWADARSLSYLGWTFNPGTCDRPSLIVDWSGTPTSYGAALHDHLATLAALHAR